MNQLFFEIFPCKVAQTYKYKSREFLTDFFDYLWEYMTFGGNYECAKKMEKVFLTTFMTPKFFLIEIVNIPQALKIKKISEKIIWSRGETFYRI